MPKQRSPSSQRRFQAASKRPSSFTKEIEGIYRLIFRVSALPGQLSAFERTRARISASDGHNCVRTQKCVFERTYFRIGQNL
jgi:hypothetical protein